MEPLTIINIVLLGAAVAVAFVGVVLALFEVRSELVEAEYTEYQKFITVIILGITVVSIVFNLWLAAITNGILAAGLLIEAAIYRYM